MSHATMLKNFEWVTGQQNSLSRSFHLALGFTIVPLWDTSLNSRKFNIGLIQLNA